MYACTSIVCAKWKLSGQALLALRKIRARTLGATEGWLKWADPFPNSGAAKKLFKWAGPGTVPLFRCVFVLIFFLFLISFPFLFPFCFLFYFTA